MHPVAQISFKDGSIVYPSPMLVFGCVLVSYFIVTAGIAYDIINEPPAVGAIPDPRTGMAAARLLFSCMHKVAPVCMQAK
jgi:hypothetical protein